MKTRNYVSVLFLLALCLAGCATELGEDLGEGSHGDVGDDGADVSGAGQALVPDAARIPLATFFNSQTGDYFSTTQPEWVCRAYNTCAQNPSYRSLGIQGYVFRPDRPRPAGTTPLYHWWNPSVGDNFLTSDSRWSGSVGAVRGGYTLYRIEGFISTSSVGGSVPLASFWNPNVADNAALNPIRNRMPTGWRRYRTEGFLVGPNSAAERRCQTGAAPNYQDPAPWHAPGNFLTNTWFARLGLMDGHVLRIGATGSTRVDVWGMHKSVSGEGTAGADWPAPGEPKFAAIGRMTSGRVWVPSKGSYAANEWFLVGGGTGCIAYDARGATPGHLHISINDPELWDNAGGPYVTVVQWW